MIKTLRDIFLTDESSRPHLKAHSTEFLAELYDTLLEYNAVYIEPEDYASLCIKVQPLFLDSPEDDEDENAGSIFKPFPASRLAKYPISSSNPKELEKPRKFRALQQGISKIRNPGPGRWSAESRSVNSRVIWEFRLAPRMGPRGEEVACLRDLTNWIPHE